MNENTTIKYEFDNMPILGCHEINGKHILIIKEVPNGRQFQLGLQSDGVVVWLELEGNEKV